MHKSTIAALLLLAGIIAPKAALACDKIEACDLREYMSKSEFEQFKRHLRDVKRSRSGKLARQAAPTVHQSAVWPSATSSGAFVRIESPPPTTSLKFLLRKDFE